MRSSDSAKARRRAAKGPMKQAPDGKPSKSERKPLKILVVGDWFIDEYWVTGPHKSDMASRIGRGHYRGLSGRGQQVASKCGAGRTATVLHLANRGADFQVYGIGLWGEADNERFESVFRSPGEASTRARGAERETRRLVNLRQLLPDTREAVDLESDDTVATTSIIRIYTAVGERIELFERIDWVSPAPLSMEDEGPAWVTKGNVSHLNDRRKGLLEFVRQGFDAVVIKDMHYGVISRALIRWLAQTLDKAVPWYVSSKAWRPEWFKDLAKVNLQLLFVPDVPAQAAIHDSELGSWVIRDRPTDDALIQLDELVGKYEQFSGVAMVLPDARTVLALDKTRKPGNVCVHRFDADIPSDIPVPLASVFFPAVVAGMLRERDLPIRDILTRARDFTARWAMTEIRRIRRRAELDQAAMDQAARTRMAAARPADAGGGDREEVFETDADIDAVKAGISVTISPLDEVCEQHKAASRYLGTIDVPEGCGTRKTLQLWRAMTELDGYICWDPGKRMSVRRIVNEVRRFVTVDRTRNVGCLIVSPPGEGKTFMVSHLARRFGMLLQSFNITQMISKSDIFDCFDTIVTTQAQNPHKPLLVFIDEINAELDGQSVYSAFLAPLEEGVYIKGSKSFHIEPCAWIFAGTHRPSEHTATGNDHATKGRDLESRLTLSEPCSLAARNVDMKRLENVYLGVNLLLAEYKAVGYVSEKVLSAFHFLDPSLGVRDIRHFVQSFVDLPQHNRVVSLNIPHHVIRRLSEEKKFDYAEWVARNADDSVLVRIET